MSRAYGSAFIVCLAMLASAAAAPAPTPGRTPAGYSAAALYNLANSFARAGKPGLAVLNYERARLLEPKDPDIEANLRHVRETSGLPADSRSKFERLAQFAEPRLLAGAGILGLCLAGAAAWTRVGRKTHRRKLFAVMLLGFGLLGISVANAVVLWPVMHQAVIIAPSTPVRVSPVTEQEPLFVLPEGSLVAVRAEHDGFVLVQTQTERSGWVPGANLARIVSKQ